MPTNNDSLPNCGCVSVSKRQFLAGSSAAMVALATQGAWANTLRSKGEQMTQDAFPLLMRKATNLPEKEVVAWLKALRGRPYVLQSGFDVTSIFKIRTPDGLYYVGGVNVENVDLTSGTCGEEGAIAAAITAFGQQIDIVEGWVMGAPSTMKTSDIACYPCGECRQRIAQYTAPDAPIHIIGLNGVKLDTKTRAQLLPNAFSFRDLEHNAVAVAPALDPVERVEERLCRQPEKPLTDSQVFEWLRGLRADVRVSNYNEMTVWRLSNGAYIAAVKVENAAYPSSTNVMSAAAAVMNARFGHHLVEEVWAYGFHNEHSKRAQKHYTLSGVSLQVLYQYAATPHVQVHAFNHDGMVRTQSLTKMLPDAPVFS